MKNTVVIMALGVLFSTVVFAQQTPNTPPANEKPANPVVKIVTSKGEIVVELFADKAPVTVENFLKYTKEGLYEGKIFHRVIKGFMIQGGGLTPDMVNKLTKKPIKNESYNKLRNERGTLAMARQNAPDSATNQFFINHKDNRSLDFDGPYKPGYAVFGKVTKGMDVVDAIALVKTGKSQYYDERYKQDVPCRDVPVEPIVIKSVTLVEKCDKKCEKCDKECDKKCDKKCQGKCGSKSKQENAEKDDDNHSCKNETKETNQK